jgi:hypothetical protein
MHPDLTRMLARERLSDLDPETPEEETHLSEIVFRRARPADAAAVARLAELDGGPVPDGATLLAEIEGELAAAIPLDGGPPLVHPACLRD